MVKPTYNCSQQALYDVCRSGWTSCNTYLANFTAFSPLYDGAYITARMAELNAAEALPDAEQRTEESRTLRINMKDAATEGIRLWKLLKLYITNAYPANEVEVKLDVAGQSHFRKAGADDWGAVSRLLTDGNAFIVSNSGNLTANNNMPPAFSATFEAAKEDFDDLYQEYITAGQAEEIDTQTKIQANNAIHASLMKMFLAGQEIFFDNEAVKKLFTFDQVLLNVTGPGNQGIKGDVTIQGTTNPVTEGEVSFTGPSSKTVEIDEDGHYECPQLAAGLYTMLVTAPGFSGVTFNDIEVVTGIMKTVDIELTPNT